MCVAFPTRPSLLSPQQPAHRQAHCQPQEMSGESRRVLRCWREEGEQLRYPLYCRRFFSTKTHCGKWDTLWWPACTAGTGGDCLLFSRCLVCFLRQAAEAPARRLRRLRQPAKTEAVELTDASNKKPSVRSSGNVHATSAGCYLSVQGQHRAAGLVPLAVARRNAQKPSYAQKPAPLAVAVLAPNFLLAARRHSPRLHPAAPPGSAGTSVSLCFSLQRCHFFTSQV